MFTSKMFLLAAFVATQAFATVAPRPTGTAVKEQFVALNTEKSAFGTITFYGANTTAPQAASLHARACGTNDVVCDGSNVPDPTSCSNLISYIGSNGNTVEGDAIRAICESTNGYQCCISWAANTPGMPIGDLYDAAVKTYNSCIVHGQSGATRNTNLNGVCTDQCLSNRAEGCS